MENSGSAWDEIRPDARMGRATHDLSKVLHTLSRAADVVFVGYGCGIEAAAEVLRGLIEINKIQPWLSVMP